MTQTALTYRTNRDLFSNHYLTDHLRDTEPWNEVDDTEVQEAYDEIRDLFEDKRDRVEDYNEAQLERNFIRPVFEILGVSYEIEETVERNARRPDYGFFETDEAADAAFDRNNFYEEAIAVADAKRWGRKLDTRGEEKRDFENPSYQIHAYLQETPTTWAVLTNGQKWRLYYGPTSHRLDSYYEIDLPTLLQHVEEGGSLEDFKDFYLFFRKDAFVEDTTGSSFLDDVYEESSVFAEALGEDLQDNIYEAIRVLAEGFLDTNDELDEDDLELIHDSSLIYLYRLIFVLYAESEGRDLLPTDNPIYRESYSLNNLKQTVAENRDETQQHYQSWQTHLWDRLEELFVLIDQGSHGMGVKKENLYIPAYNGGLFRTDPGPDDSEEAQFLANYEAGDAYLAEVIDLLTRREADDGEGQVFVDYSSLDERHLGSIYEGLLEYKLDVADEPLTVEDSEYVPAGDGDDIEVSQGDVYLRTDAGERKATGSYYTPEYVVEYIVDETLEPLIDDIQKDLMAQDPFDKEGGGQFAEDFADRVFDLKILDPAMGSGHFLVNAVDYLAREIIDAQERQDQQAVKAGNEEAISEPRTEEGELRDINWARRKVAQRCIYGVDLNPLATELAKVSLWLRTLAAEQPLAFLDHHLKTGNSLVGSDIEDVLDNGNTGTEEGQLTLQQSFDRTRQQALEHVMERFQDLLSIDNETLEDIKEMEGVYDEVRDDPLYQHLIAMANVHTAESFGLNVPEDAYEQMAEALRDDSWDDIEKQDWYHSAQALADDKKFFHWELEFPVAFYGEDGKRKQDAGFDAVIGNPPYGKEISSNKKDYYNSEFQHQEYQLDRYLLFLEQCARLPTTDGRIGLIIPNTWLMNLKFDNIRDYIFNDTTVHSVVEYEQSVFPEVTVETISLIFSIGEPTDNQIQVQKRSYEEAVSKSKIEQKSVQNRTGASANLFAGAATRSIEEKFADSPKLKDICDIHNGVKPFEQGKGNPPQTQKIVEEKPYVSDEKEDDSFRPLLRGSLIEQYLIKWNGDHWISYGEQLAAPRDPEIFDADEKIVIRQTGDSLIAALDRDQFVVRNNMHAILPKKEKYSLPFILSIINSTFSNWYYQEIINPEKGEALAEVKKGHIIQLPVPSLDSNFIGDKISFSSEEEIPTCIEDCNTILDTQNSDLELSQKYDQIVLLSECMRILKEERNKLNLNLLDYLGSMGNGPKLAGMNLIPGEDVSSSILSETTKQRDKLRLGGLEISRDRNDVTLLASGRYKPADEDDAETDQWGYTETEYREAFTLANLSEREADLVEAFVPVAVDKASGFANFRKNATKTNSLIDRLKALTIPKPNEISADLERYLEAKKHADELDGKIEKTNQLIDEIVYTLYGLSEEEIEVVEETMATDD